MKPLYLLNIVHLCLYVLFAYMYEGYSKFMVSQFANYDLI